ncbi:mechanosensitive ion channel protein 2, chloroplastic isoform X1 [Ipomoea triloba]|uniref:mechanosensitive ion channel protein 2, chloroplastic isoform X1 n=1 Tax=Ipomoea triloba TaxID=35885 RepID=UPI00125CE2C2|nr:mechanosensitive ion channel protein 2, chloroplastic isoform X1 [Ipomoea triloba]XP_031108784.1 mechanosensitive ion channel protein 2, chloroplastic isoform X1 [Ipomoea triloba]XP_031108785.1 mechanosensitive ion channel protein 2, chloroplastic isoform X1 [Ipomoea triloba]
MAAVGSLQLPHHLGICKNHAHHRRFRNEIGGNKLQSFNTRLSSFLVQRDYWSLHLSKRLQVDRHALWYRNNRFRCNAFLKPGQPVDITCIKNGVISVTSCLQNRPLVLKLIPAVGIIAFGIWGLGPLLRQSRNLFPHKSDSSWGKSKTYHVMTSYLQPLVLWTGAMLVCRAVDPMVLPTEASQIVKQRLLNFVRSLSTVLAFAYCLSSVIQHTQKFFMETNESSDARNMGFQFAGRAIYTAVWVAAVSLFMELLGFSTQKWLTAGGLGTVLITLAGREIFTNFLSSIMIHATRPFVLNEWIQTRIEGYEVSGTVEHVGWWSPTIIRGEDREAVHIPNHKFTVNVVRNLTQKTHWRIKTHLAISHLDVSKINNIVADMRKVLAKNPQVEQKKLHKRVFLENINPENQALLILISCFVKTSHFEEYLCVKEAILLDLLRVIRHHRARLATPIRTVQKVYSDADLDNIPFASDSVFNQGAASSRPLLLIEPPYKVNGEDRTKARPLREEDVKGIERSAPDNKADSKSRETPASSSNANDISTSDSKLGQVSNVDIKEDHKVIAKTSSDPKPGSKATVKTTSKLPSKPDQKSAEVSSSDSSDPQPKKGNLENVSLPNTDNSSLLPEDSRDKTDSVPSTSQSKRGDEKTDSVSSTSQSKRGDERPLASQSSSSKPALEENIVLGVALEGSKRTLPIEDGMEPPPNSAEAKELAMSHSSSNGSVEKEKKQQSQRPSNHPGSGDQLGQQE